jgi:hypothetical protein
MKINVRHEKGYGMERLVVWRRPYFRVVRGLDGFPAKMSVPAYYLEWVPF